MGVAGVGRLIPRIASFFSTEPDMLSSATHGFITILCQLGPSAQAWERLICRNRLRPLSCPDHASCSPSGRFGPRKKVRDNEKSGRHETYAHFWVLFGGRGGRRARGGSTACRSRLTGSTQGYLRSQTGQVARESRY